MNTGFVPLGAGFGAEAFGAVEGLCCSFPLTEVTLQHESVSNTDTVYTETRRTKDSSVQSTHGYSNPHRLFWGHGRHPKLFIPLFIPLFLTSYYYLYCTNTNTFCDICNTMIIAFYLFHPIGIFVKACAKQ